MTEETRKRPHLLIALIPVVFLVGALYLSMVHYKELELKAHIPLILGTVVAGIISLFYGLRFKDIEKAMVKGISLAMSAILILLVIGILVGSWIQSGIVPAMIVYGLDLLSPPVFLAATCGICSLIALATGSSWSTVATVGIALIGVGEGLGIPKHMIAGAIISGAYFGDKMSPLSDTTNLAPAVAGSNLFDHIRHMAYTTGPSLLISLIAFGILGWGTTGEVDTASVESIRAVINSGFTIHPLLLLPPLLVIVMVVLRLPALPALIGGIMLGWIIAWLFQDTSFGEILKVAYAGVTFESENAVVNELLTRGGLSSMFSTVALIICALSFGGVMERSLMLEAIAGAILKLARGVAGLVGATLATCAGMNVLAADQYLVGRYPFPRTPE